MIAAGVQIKSNQYTKERPMLTIKIPLQEESRINDMHKKIRMTLDKYGISNQIQDITLNDSEEDAISLDVSLLLKGTVFNASVFTELTSLSNDIKFTYEVKK